MARNRDYCRPTNIEFAEAITRALKSSKERRRKRQLVADLNNRHQISNQIIDNVEEKDRQVCRCHVKKTTSAKVHRISPESVATFQSTDASKHIEENSEVDEQDKHSDYDLEPYEESVIEEYRLEEEIFKREETNYKEEDFNSILTQSDLERIDKLSTYKKQRKN
ncbi:uncharacterized protein LOC109860107 [Pseudomyrmex gracilis]|uniref:uncharacterized protein LOC109860107 n=1 Tax=Pseudomyrmex gracilis TaxID=219809 RepID=UPI000994CA9E|nr:uncharacterized protein LOC109860107 [Pseudomyrmex gracilis]